MGKTLYISDLDGTLLGREGTPSAYTVDIIHGIMAEGGLFTLATARSLQSSQKIAEQLGLRLPLVLNNGAMIYDLESKTYMQINALPKNVVPLVLELLHSEGVCGFLYTLENDLLSIYYQHLYDDREQDYLDQRQERYNGRLYQVPDIMEIVRQREVVYLVAYGESRALERARLKLEQLTEITCELYSNVYDDGYFMDIFPSTASKANGMLALQKHTGADELVAFGDNFNDLTMLLAADRSYVPKNAVDAAKNLATAVLDYSHNDGVARFLAQEFSLDVAVW